MVHFIEIFKKYAELTVIDYLLTDTSPHYVNEVAKKAGVSTGTASTTLRFFESAGLLTHNKIGNVKQYSLVDSPLVKELKVLFALSRLDAIGCVELFLEEDSNIASIILYGSFADGTYDSKSDMDLLLVSESKTDFSALLSKLEQKLGREISLLKYRLSDLEKLKSEDKVFYDDVKINHKVLFGAKLP